jgi:hypothetical protein
LIVEIGTLRIDHASFGELATTHGGVEFADGKRVAFIQALNTARASAPTLSLAPNWTGQGVAQALTEQDIEGLRSRYARGELVSVRAPITVRPKVGGAQVTWFDLYLQSSPDVAKGEAFFVRGAITIPGEAKRFRGRNCLGALVASDQAIASFLGDAEGPAHTTWSGTAEKVVEGWKAPGDRLREIRDSLNQLYAVVAQVTDKVDPDALLDVFFVKRAGAAPTSRQRNPVVKRRDVPRIPRNPSMIRLDERKGGFVVRSTTTAELPITVRVRVAYDLVEGNPLKQHSKFDFDLTAGELSVASIGATTLALSSNELRIEASESEFSVAVNGFDENRDLFVKAEVIK